MVQAFFTFYYQNEIPLCSTCHNRPVLLGKWKTWNKRGD